MPDMRFAPAPVLLAGMRSNGLNQTGLRSHNERLILDLLRRAGTLSRFEIGQSAGLSAQTVSVVVRALLAEGMLTEGEIHRGRVGPPTTPFSLNPNGACAIGIYAGIEVADLCIVDLCGGIRAEKRVLTGKDRDLSALLAGHAADLLAGLDPALHGRCMGVGVALNRRRWNTAADGAAQALAQIEASLTQTTGLSCYLLDDAKSAATGELLFGGASTQERFAFIHIGMMTNIGLVLNGQAQPARSPDLHPLTGIEALARQIIASGGDPTALWTGGPVPDSAMAFVPDWLDRVARDVSEALITILAVLDLGQVVLAAPLPRDVLDDLTARLNATLQARGMDLPVRPGVNANHAKAAGAAASVLSTRFSPEWGRLLEEAEG